MSIIFVFFVTSYKRKIGSKLGTEKYIALKWLAGGKGLMKNISTFVLLNLKFWMKDEYNL